MPAFDCRTKVGNDLAVSGDGDLLAFLGLSDDPLYVDVIVRRYQAATAEPEVLAETAGRSTRWRRVGREAASEPAGAPGVRVRT